MIIRKKNELLEKNILSPLAALSTETKGRKIKNKKCPLRTEYQRDRDRILHSTAFRKLKRKTQVFIAPEGDYFRTRLTHTLEVSQISRTIARSLRLNEDLIEAICLGHDIGHTPFGHMGEIVLQEMFDKKFRHAFQSLRVVDTIEKKGKGLNLTYEVRNGIVSHSKLSKNIFKINNEYKPQTLEAEVVRIADSIAYINHDIDDAIYAGIIKLSDLPANHIKIVGKRHSQRINTMVIDIIENSKDKKHIHMSDKIKNSTNILRKYLFKNVYFNPKIYNEAKKAQKILKQLFEYFYDNYKKEYDYIRKVIYPQKNDNRKRIIADFICYLTDQEIMNLYRQKLIPKTFY